MGYELVDFEKAARGLVPAAERLRLIVPAIAALISPVFAVIGYLQPTAIGTMLVMLIPGLVGSLWYGPVYASGQSLVPPHMRATAASVLLFIINLVGLGAGAETGAWTGWGAGRWCACLAAVE